jgi:hypothetical protein
MKLDVYIPPVGKTDGMASTRALNATAPTANSLLLRDLLRNTNEGLDRPTVTIRN